jgi:hypothetical protein
MRRFIDLVEEANAIPSEVVDRILSDYRVKRGVKIPASARLWRGESEESGSGMATYGLGLYFTCDRKFAARYGTVREVERSSLPYNCLRFDNNNDFEIWYQTAFKLMGYNDNRDVWKDFHGMDEFIRHIDMSVDGLQIGKSKDAMFVLYP